MTCRHGPNDPNCSSHPLNEEFVKESKALYDRYRSEDSPNADRYPIEDSHRVGSHLVLKVNYPNCRLCEFEGSKIMVFLNVSESQVLKWRKIDPHFRSGPNIGPDLMPIASEAPSPAARFPATPEGWADAIEYATRKAPK